MKYLLDTHTFLWFNEGSSELSKEAKEIILNSDNELFISIASLWEISIKTAIGKLEIKGDYELILEDVVENNITILPINFAHTVVQNKLEFHHRDPFDRIITAQSIVEKIDLISRDKIFDDYFTDFPCKRIW
jgi:PIN domain nuclease of toxin-antitoxin system